MNGKAESRNSAADAHEELLRPAAKPPRPACLCLPECLWHWLSQWGPGCSAAPTHAHTRPTALLTHCQRCTSHAWSNFSAASQRACTWSQFLRPLKIRLSRSMNDRSSWRFLRGSSFAELRTRPIVHRFMHHVGNSPARNSTLGCATSANPHEFFRLDGRRHLRPRSLPTRSRTSDDCGRVTIHLQSQTNRVLPTTMLDM